MSYKTLLMFALVAAWPTAGTAQQPRPHDYVATATSVVLARSASLSRRDARAMIIRRPQSPMHIIVLTNEATPTDLAAAMAALLRVRRASGDTLRAEQRAWITDVERRRARPTREALAAASRDLQRLQSAESMLIPGLGTLPVTLIDGRMGPDRR